MSCNKQHESGLSLEEIGRLSALPYDRIRRIRIWVDLLVQAQDNECWKCDAMAKDRYTMLLALLYRTGVRVKT